MDKEEQNQSAGLDSFPQQRIERKRDRIVEHDWKSCSIETRESDKDDNSTRSKPVGIPFVWFPALLESCQTLQSLSSALILLQNPEPLNPKP